MLEWIWIGILNCTFSFGIRCVKVSQKQLVCQHLMHPAGWGHLRLWSTGVCSRVRYGLDTFNYLLPLTENTVLDPDQEMTQSACSYLRQNDDTISHCKDQPIWSVEGSLYPVFFYIGWRAKQLLICSVTSIPRVRPQYLEWELLSVSVMFIPWSRAASSSVALTMCLLLGFS